MNEISLRDAVLRRDIDGQLYLMICQEGGWRQKAILVGDETELSKYNARLGTWSRDEHGDFCPVICLSRSEQPTVNDLPAVLRERTRAQMIGQILYEEGVLEDLSSREDVHPGMQEFIELHPGVRFGFGPGPFLVALMPDGTAMAVDQDGTVIAAEELGDPDAN